MNSFSNISYKEKELVVETHRSGLFKFQVGVCPNSIAVLAARVSDAQDRFRKIPMLPDIMSKVQKAVVVSSVHGTNTIEGGTLTLEETESILEGNELKGAEKDQRVININNAYTSVEEIAKSARLKARENHRANILIEEEMIRSLHKLITTDLLHPLNVPGQFRNNSKGQLTKIGDLEHGGIYVAPKCLDDISMLIRAYIEWLNSDELINISPIIRAPLAHYYLELIHPFWDGNGRLGRVIEALILKVSGFKYAPFALSKYYLENLDDYFILFNKTRKQAAAGEKFPLTDFVVFFLEGLLSVLNELHDNVSMLTGVLLYETRIDQLLRQNKINSRQSLITHYLLPMGPVHKYKKTITEPWFTSLYAKLTTRTRDRDLAGLEKEYLIKITSGPDKKIRLLIPGLNK